MNNNYAIESTRDEFGAARFFIADDSADWVAGPFPTREAAADALAELDAGEAVSGPADGTKGAS